MRHKIDYGKLHLFYKSNSILSYFRKLTISGFHIDRNINHTKRSTMIMIVVKSVLILVGCILGCGVLGFLIPFIIALFDPTQNPAWSFIPMITVPIGFGIGFFLGIYLIFRFYV
ncbi:hypothetical protein [Leptospira sp. GIMC2001]|uniref:hypothetical protein n=1 Tax=Leptospira sp. GIMC2001 TaxID=1513297 RepID=UPI00234A0E64|nr:hypothetical protein [Leptospira sp. GIMC2001]WCL47606.1 hypothetical protein O4O04_01165 [Leptospira sp. GIMC2001]